MKKQNLIQYIFFHIVGNVLETMECTECLFSKFKKIRTFLPYFVIWNNNVYLTAHFIFFSQPMFICILPKKKNVSTKFVIVRILQLVNIYWGKYVCIHKFYDIIYLDYSTSWIDSDGHITNVLLAIILTHIHVYTVILNRLNIQIIYVYYQNESSCKVLSWLSNVLRLPKTILTMEHNGHFN